MAALTRDHVYESFEYTASVAKTKGLVEKINDVYGFWFLDVSAGSDGTFLYKCKQVRIGKKTGTGEAINQGDRVYGDPADSYNVSPTKSAGFIFLGYAKEAATASDTDVLIEFIGTMWDLL
jgi:hypothetical protein